MDRAVFVQSLVILAYLKAKFHSFLHASHSLTHSCTSSFLHQSVKLKEVMFSPVCLSVCLCL